MKKYLIALSAFTVITITASAQTKNNSADATTPESHGYMHHNMRHGYGMHHHHGMMMKGLNFTDAQKQQVKDLNTNYRNQLSALEKSETITLKDYRSQKANLEKERRLKFESILTADQKNKIAQAKKDMGEKMKMMAQKRMEKMKTDLQLTDDQVAKIQDQRKSSMEQMKAIRENSSLSEEQKKEQLMDLRKTSHDNMNKILTADQLKKKEELRNNRIKEMKSKWENKAS